MGFYRGPKLYNDGLVLALEAGSNRSYPGSGTVWKDLSGYGNNGTLANSPTHEGNHFSFDGTNDHVELDQNGASTATNVAHTGYGNFTGAYNDAYTIEIIIRTTDSGGNSIFGQPIISDLSSGIWGALSMRSGKFSFALYDSSWKYVESTSDINDGVFHHCVVVHHADETVDIYVDGVQEQQGVTRLIRPTSRYFKMITLMEGYNAAYHDGELSTVRVYDQALTQDQVVQNYNAFKGRLV